MHTDSVRRWAQSDGEKATNEEYYKLTDFLEADSPSFAR